MAPSGGGGEYHFLGHLLGDVARDLEQELDGVVIFVFALKLPVVAHEEPELQRRLGAVVHLSQVHTDPQLLLEEPVTQQLLGGEPAGGERDLSGVAPASVA